MAKKTYLRICCPSAPDADAEQEPISTDEPYTYASIDELTATNDRLMRLVTDYKNKITPFYHNRSWDKYKKVSNEYELIFTTPYAKHNVSPYNPVSRSFFKMWELLHDFKEEIIPQTSGNGAKFLFLAEGPGGFLEAVMKYRNNPLDHYYGMTLRPDHKSIPEWKLKKFEGLAMHQITTLYGADDKGDLYNLENTHHVAMQLGMNSMELVTADGGFDFSSNFNGQEDLSSKLIKCETYCALHLLKDKGTFILKIYDMFHEHTLWLMQLLYQSFDYIYITKPVTSRPANSEKYLVCCGYNASKGLSNVGILKENIIHHHNDANQATITSTVYNNKLDIDRYMLYNIVMYNAYYTSRQVFYIQKTIEYISEYEALKPTDRYKRQDIVIAHNREKCKKWCVKYNMHSIT
jgi:23S rRNA U2552 (ribose-2'-O)-methylase RlmE/FtsJ